jgi:hypothetical protein
VRVGSSGEAEQTAEESKPNLDQKKTNAKTDWRDTIPAGGSDSFTMPLARILVRS